MPQCYHKACNCFVHRLHVQTLLTRFPAKLFFFRKINHWRPTYHSFWLKNCLLFPRSKVVGPSVVAYSNLVSIWLLRRCLKQNNAWYLLSILELFTEGLLDPLWPETSGLETDGTLRHWSLPYQFLSRTIFSYARVFYERFTTTFFDSCLLFWQAANFN